MRTSILLPTMRRPVQAVRCVNRLFDTTRGLDVECIVVVECDMETVNQLCAETDAIVVYRDVHKGPVYGWNQAAELATGAAFVLAGDDIWWADGWLERALAHVRNGIDFVGLNDGHRDGRIDVASHFLATRRHCIEVQGGVFACPHYRHYGLDNEACDKARAAGRYVWAQDALVEHMHPQWRTATDDETYLRAKLWKKADGETYQRRKAEGFPHDFQAFLGVTC